MSTPPEEERHVTSSSAGGGQLHPRSIRVFLSSTFADMQVEREELVKRTFPRLRALCEQRGVSFTEVDLRWGVTDEAKAEGRVLPICLAEISGCRPFFLGILGERYGWVPETIPEELVEREPWLAEHRERSVTELEILHGVLADPAMSENAFFYFRDPTYLETIPSDERSAFVETDPAARAKLATLKERIRQSGLPVREQYADPNTLNELVYQDLSRVVDRLYPPTETADPVQRERAAHEAHAESLARVYFARESDFASLDAHVEGDGLPLVVLGESGAGKSALLANWALQWRTANPGTPVIMHFVGANPGSAAWTALVRRLIQELAQSFDLAVEIPSDSDELRLAFADVLHMSAAKGRVVLVLDGLDQIEDRDAALELGWLPVVVPANVRLLLSTLPCQALDELERRRWPALTVDLLSEDDRGRLAVAYLAQYRKELSPQRLALIAGAPQSANPLYLRTLLEELRLWGDHHTLEPALQGYLGAADAHELFGLVLQRYERDYDRDRPGLTRDAMTLLWAARRGLSEAELLDLLGSDNGALPRACFSPLYLAVRTGLVDRGGCLMFAHAHLRTAVESRYLNEDSRRAAHLTLADYFEGHEWTVRRFEELPWHLQEASQWDRLLAVLTEPKELSALWLHAEEDVPQFWARVESVKGARPREAYRDVIANPSAHKECLVAVATLVARDGDEAAASLLLGHLIEDARRSDEQVLLAAYLGWKAALLVTLEDPRGALSLAEESAHIAREADSPDALLAALNVEAGIHRNWGDWNRTTGILREVEDIAARSGRLHQEAFATLVHAAVLTDMGDFDGALEKAEQGERVARAAGDADLRAFSLLTQASCLAMDGRRNEAKARLQAAERIAGETYLRDVTDKRLLNRMEVFAGSYRNGLRYGGPAVMLLFVGLLWYAAGSVWQAAPVWMRAAAIALTIVAFLFSGLILATITPAGMARMSRWMILCFDRVSPRLRRRLFGVGFTRRGR